MKSKIVSTTVKEGEFTIYEFKFVQFGINDSIVLCDKNKTIKFLSPNGSMELDMAMMHGVEFIKDPAKVAPDSFLRYMQLLKEAGKTIKNIKEYRTV